MRKLAILKLGEGAIDRGFPVTLQIGEEGARPDIETLGKLPADADLREYYRRWQVAYRRLGSAYRLSPKQGYVTNVSHVEDCTTAADRLSDRLNLWLNSDAFRPIREKLLEYLHPDDEVRLILQVEDLFVQRLPWHVWDWFDRYAKAEIAIGTPDYQRIETTDTTEAVRILAILGHSEGIDTQADFALLDRLPDAEVELLIEPDRQTLTERLWEPKGWDILFFAGHSSSQLCSSPIGVESDRLSGKIFINPSESLSIAQLKNALKKAIERGLKIAIFNSCDGLGLARELADLHIPQILVMREPVPDRVAQEFLKYFLEAFARGESFYLAVREAREKLQGLEDRFPCATWLPSICQNPAVLPPNWQALRGGVRDRIAAVDRPVTMVFTDLINSTAVKQYLPGKDANARNQLYFHTILQPHRQRVEASLAAYGGRVVKTEGDAYFLVFDSAAQAAQWAVTLQESHIRNPISTPLGTLQVRIGMHAGSPLADGDDFIGQEVDYAARVSALAKGKQILLSEVSALFVRNAQIAGLTLHSLGDRSLKGIGDVPIFELLYADGQQIPTQKPRTLGQGGWVGNLLASTLVAVVTIGLRLSGILQPLELQALDTLMQLRPAEPPDLRLVVVAVTEADVQAQDPKQRRGSLSDETLDRLLQKLSAFQPRAIGLDIYRDFPAASPHLAQQLRQTDNFITICKVSDRTSRDPGIPPSPEIPIERLGFSDFTIDPDGKVRRQLLTLTPEPTSPCATTSAFNLQLAARYLAAEGIHPSWTADGNLQLGNLVLRRLQPRMGGYQNIDTGGNQILLNYRHPDRLATQVTLGDILADRVRGDIFKESIVLIGTTARSFGDYWLTPYSPNANAQIPGVLLQAQMVSQLLGAALDKRPLLWVLPQWGDAIWILGWSCAGGLLVWGWQRSGRSDGLWIVGVGILVALLGGSSWLAFVWRGCWLPLVPGAIGAIGAAGSVVYLRFALPKSP
jgi:CHASE2 domain-containing sensor protein/class 3 adenylate cyclase